MSTRLDPALVHSSWAGEDDPQPEDSAYIDLDRSPLRLPNRCTCQLKFSHTGGEEAIGTGFFVNVPSTQQVILTAAHNLVDATGSQFENLSVIYVDEQRNEKRVTIQTRHVCSKYKPGRPETDYGVILLPLGEVSEAPFGYGFNLKLGETDVERDIEVVGYNSASTPGNPVASRGAVRYYPGYLEYRAGTEQGLSGSPVWLGYEGFPTVVGVHNHGPQNGGKYSRGARLTSAVLREVFDWVGVLGHDQMICVTATPKNRPKIPTRGLFLSFKAGMGFGRVRLGSGSKFEMWPAAGNATVPAVAGSPATAGSPKARYYLALSTDGQWVDFNPTKGELRLSRTLKDGCFFFDKELKKKSGKAFLLDDLFAKASTKMFQLELRKGAMEDGPDADSDDEQSQVYLIEYPKTPEAADGFTNFAMDPENKSAKRYTP